MRWRLGYWTQWYHICDLSLILIEWSESFVHRDKIWQTLVYVATAAGAVGNTCWLASDSHGFLTMQILIKYSVKGTMMVMTAAQSHKGGRDPFHILIHLHYSLFTLRKLALPWLASEVFLQWTDYNHPYVELTYLAVQSWAVNWLNAKISWFDFSYIFTLAQLNMCVKCCLIILKR